jgi:hypothetical protein
MDRGGDREERRFRLLLVTVVGGAGNGIGRFDDSQYNTGVNCFPSTMRRRLPEKAFAVGFLAFGKLRKVSSIESLTTILSLQEDDCEDTTDTSSLTGDVDVVENKLRAKLGELERRSMRGEVQVTAVIIVDP